MQTENPVCSVNSSISQWSPSQVKKRYGPALPAIQLHTHRDYPYSSMRKRHSIEIPTSKQRSWYQNLLPLCGTSIRDMYVDLPDIIRRSISNKPWSSKSISSLENGKFSMSHWHPRLSGLSSVTTWSPTDGTHMTCEAVLKTKMNHVKVNLILHVLRTSQVLLERRESNILPLIFMLWYAHHLNTEQNALHYLSLQDSDVHLSPFKTSKPDSLSLEQAP